MCYLQGRTGDTVQAWGSPADRTQVEAKAGRAGRAWHLDMICNGLNWTMIRETCSQYDDKSTKLNVGRWNLCSLRQTQKRTWFKRNQRLFVGVDGDGTEKILRTVWPYQTWKCHTWQMWKMWRKVFLCKQLIEFLNLLKIKKNTVHAKSRLVSFWGNYSHGVEVSLFLNVLTNNQK